MTTARRSLARYGAVEGALASGFVTAELHHPAGHDLASESCVTFFRILPSQAKAGDGRLEP